MTPNPDVVVRADRLLQQAETIPDHERRARQIREAFDLLDTYLKESPNSEHREYVENRKQSYMRSHLKCLSTVREPDRETWLFNYILFVMSEREVAQVLGQHEELRAWYDAFVQSQSEWARKELVPLLERSGTSR
jgi:hypothetical protein